MEFSANNPIVKLCMQGMALRDQGSTTDAHDVFLQAWEQATHDLEKFLAAHFVAHSQSKDSKRLQWLETALMIALKIDDDTVKSALPILYADIADCYESLNEAPQATRIKALAKSYDVTPTDKGPFFHGTKASLNTGDLLTPGGESNYKADLKMNHIYFTASINGAGLAAGLAKGEQKERVYIVEPTGPFEHDPNVTNKKFPGNPTRSYRSHVPLKIVGEVPEWKQLTTDEIRQWREKLAKNKGEIIN